MSLEEQRDQLCQSSEHSFDDLISVSESVFSSTKTIFIICVCNNQLLDWIENELIWMLNFVPGLEFVLPKLVSKLHAVKGKYMDGPPVSSNLDKANKWSFSFAAVWNTVVWLMLMNFFIKIVNATAQQHMRKQQEVETAERSNALGQLVHV